MKSRVFRYPTSWRRKARCRRLASADACERDTGEASSLNESRPTHRHLRVKELEGNKWDGGRGERDGGEG